MQPVPLVSVVIPNFNYARSLALCLAALARQTYPAVEVIVIDDHSTDESVAVAERMGARVLRTARRASGCAAGRNVGVEHSSGEVLFFLDSDVALEPDAIANAVRILADDPRIGAVCGVYHPEPLVLDSRVEEYRGLQLHYWQASSEGRVSNMYPAMTAMRRTVFDDVGPFNPALKQTEDADYGHRVSQRYDLVLSARISGRHDHDATLGLLLRKVFHRTRLRIPLYARRRRFAKGFETATRGWGCVAAISSVPALLLPLFVGPLGVLVPVGLIGVSVQADLGMYRFVNGRRGARFLAFFALMQYLANITIACGLVAGVAQWSVSRRFRELYDETVRPKEAVSGA
ncbi:glycosyltransferase family 2 protein [Micromonospora sp. WMMA1998]|uniref:glycosyltransferase n=1 Tax=Micromonospora sp. WMMA1998 TaxID=3015167 RepID=UPI00248AC5DB|nr:glycosyltransferase family 2 protein [Micromonospora sp. WMMA1998]WBC14830.1 glycosyltransferase family 2 protein [Micromonospora sp. WMMA1998]